MMNTAHTAGTRTEKTGRTGRVQRLCKDSHPKCLEKMNEDSTDKSKGTAVYLRVVRENISIFYSKKTSLLERAESASYVIHFLARWRMWVLKHKDPQVDAHFITDEAHKGCASCPATRPPLSSCAAEASAKSRRWSWISPGQVAAGHSSRSTAAE